MAGAPDSDQKVHGLNPVRREIYLTTEGRSHKAALLDMIQIMLKGT